MDLLERVDKEIRKMEEDLDSIKKKEDKEDSLDKLIKKLRKEFDELNG